MMTQWVVPEHYTAFENEDQAISFCKDWGLLPQKATKQKLYRYKGQNMDVPCEIVGYADLVFAVIQIGEQLHNIHPSYLREMQTGQYGKSKPEEDVEVIEGDVVESELVDTNLVETEWTNDEGSPAVKKADKAEVKKTEKKEKKTTEKPAKEAPITLPEGKVNVEATVIEFASVPNPFSETDDEVIIFEQVSFLVNDETAALESAWSSHSNAFKKLELQIGDKLAFEAKLVPKKLSKHPVKYKINNAAKISKFAME
jgi:hypothetical protein